MLCVPPPPRVKPYLDPPPMDLGRLEISKGPSKSNGGGSTLDLSASPTDPLGGRRGTGRFVVILNRQSDWHKANNCPRP